MSEHDFEDYLSLLGGLLRLDPQQRGAITDELRDHMLERMEELARGGVTEEDARRQALREFGDAAGLASEFTQLNRNRRRRKVMRYSMFAGTALSLVIALGWAMWPQNARVPAANVAEAQAPPTAAPAETTVAAESDEEVVEVELPVLEQLTSAELNEVPLNEAMQFFGQSHNTQFYLDQRALADEGIGGDTLISISLKEIPLKMMLDLITRQVGAAWYVRETVIIITSPAAVTSNLEIQTYNVRDLATTDEAAEELVTLIEESVACDSWDRVGGAASLRTFNGILVVNQTSETHREMADLLKQLREANDAIQAGAAASFVPAIPFGTTPALPVTPSAIPAPSSGVPVQSAPTLNPTPALPHLR